MLVFGSHTSLFSQQSFYLNDISICKEISISAIKRMIHFASRSKQ